MKARETLLPGLLLLAALTGCADRPSSRTVEYTERVRLPPQKGAVRLWLPVPPSNEYQKTELLKVETDFPYRITQEGDFGNSILYIEHEGKEPLNVTLRYRITRTLQRGLRRKKKAGLSEKERELYTSPRGLLAVNDRLKALAQKQAGGESDPLKVARKFYSYVLGFMAYNKKAPGWGQGDSMRACVVGLGNCTDFHSLFQSLAMVKEIPTRFMMGLPLKESGDQTLGKTYHCWVEFHISGRGWIPMDISEAWKVKHGEKDWDEEWTRDYFGKLDEHRILLSSGREIRLEPAQDGPPLNYFAYPYAEVAGKPASDLTFERTVRDLSPRESI